MRWLIVPVQRVGVLYPPRERLLMPNSAAGLTPPHPPSAHFQSNKLLLTLTSCFQVGEIISVISSSGWEAERPGQDHGKTIQERTLPASLSFTHRLLTRTGKALPSRVQSVVGTTAPGAEAEARRVIDRGGRSRETGWGERSRRVRDWCGPALAL